MLLKDATTIYKRSKKRKAPLEKKIQDLVIDHYTEYLEKKGVKYISQIREKYFWEYVKKQLGQPTNDYLIEILSVYMDFIDLKRNKL